MSMNNTCHTVKKTYFYNFYPSDWERGEQRMLVEIRDVVPPPGQDGQNPWQIKKALSQYEIASGKIIVSFNDTFQYILRHWNFCMAQHLAVSGHRVAVVLWDVTNERSPRRYEGNHVFFQITQTRDNFILTCMEMMRDRNLKMGDYIGIYWDSTDSTFRIKLFYSPI